MVRKSQYGKQLMEAGRFAEAVGVYREMVRVLPGNPGLLLNLALAERMAGMPRAAIPHFEAVLKAEPGNLPALLSLGAAHLDLNEPRAAVAPLEKVVAAAGGNRDARGMLAGALYALGRLEQAAGQYRALARITPSDPQAWFGLGRSYESLAARALEQLEKAGPQSAYMSVLLADSRAQQRQYRSAFFFYRQALEQTRFLPGVHAGLAEVYRRTDHEDWAAEEERREKATPAPDCGVRPAACRYLAGDYLGAAAAARARGTPENFFWQGKAYNELARAALAKLGELPESAEIHAVKAEILSNHGQHLEAAAEWREALRLDPGKTAYAQELARALFLAGDYRAALPMVERFLQADPESAGLNLLAGDSLLRLDEVARCIPYLEKAVRRDPKLVAARASLGLAYARVGKPAQAVPHLEAALAFDDDGSLHYQLARAYQSAGETAKAQRMMVEYQQIQKKAAMEKEELAKATEIGPPQ